MAEPSTEPILVVDDSLTVRMDLAEALERSGLRCRLCATAAEARAALAAESFPVVILDVRLPDGDGIELLREIRSRDGDPPTAVVLLSTEAEVRDRVRGMATGADEYVGKPYDATYVVARTRELVRQRTASDPPERDTILLVDDSPTFRQHIEDALTDAGWQVVTAATGEEGLRLAAQLRPAAVVVDGELPGIDGPTVIRRLRLDAALRAIPCLLLTAADGPDVELRALDAGADAFLRKESDAAPLVTRVGAMLRRTAVRGGGRATASLLGPKRILVASGSPERGRIAEALQGEGHDVILARSGEGLLELLEVQPVDCAVVDLDLPGLSGDLVCRAIRASAALRETAVVALSADQDREATLRAFDAGADDCVARSVDVGLLRARVAAQLRRKQLEDEGRRAHQMVLERELQEAEARAARTLAETRAALLEDLARKNEELEAFSYSVSHDLRAPLRAISGFSSALLEDHAEELSDDARDLTRRVCAAAARMDRLIDDLLALSQVGRAPLRRRRVDVTAIARELAAELRRSDPARLVTFAIEDGLVADADAGLVRIVLENLLRNAWKFTARSEEQHITVDAVPGSPSRVFRVRDTGVGFDMEHAARLFAPFQRLHPSHSFEGTGIGLATVRRAIERHGGRVWAEGAVGRGATFSFTLEGSHGGASTSRDAEPSSEEAQR